MPSGATFLPSDCFGDVILSGSHFIVLGSCVKFLIVFLTNQFSVFFLIAKHIIVRWDGRRMHFVPRNMCPVRILMRRRAPLYFLCCPLLLNFSLRLVLAWTGEPLLLKEYFVAETVDL